MTSDSKPPLAANSSLQDQPAEARPARGALHLWLRRAGVLLFVFLCATIGVLLIIMPWRPEWTENQLLLPYPAVREVFGSGFVRGVCTGLGVLNVWIGFWEAVQYSEDE